MTLPPRESSILPALRLDCRHYRGDRPCAVGIQGLCPERCALHDKQGTRILIIKLGALGDVIRTAALLPGLKAEWPESHITWVTRPAGVRLLTNHPLIDRLLPFDAETICHIELESFDLCLSLDKEPGPAALAMRVRAGDRRGIGMSAFGTPTPLNADAAYYFTLGLDDTLKFYRNDQSYQSLVYAAVGLRYRGETYRLYPGPAERRQAAALLCDLGILDTDTVVGLNTGAGRVFANKNWSERQYIDLARRLTQDAGVRVVLLGGPEERTRNQRIADACPGARNTGCDHHELLFAAIAERCRVVVTGDTLGMHVAIACGVPCIALFGPTCAQEIDLFERGEKIVTSLPCSPCYRRSCDKTPNCMDVIAVERVASAVARWIAGHAPETRLALPLAETLA
jgi:heptosyltransferase-2